MYRLFIFIFLGCISGGALARTTHYTYATEAQPEVRDACAPGGNSFWKENLISESLKQKMKNPQVMHKTTSVIIPCYFRHARHLLALLRMYEEQTVLPNEIVISLSEIQRVDPRIIEELQNELWAFPITLVVSKHKRYAGENRNIACSYAQGDVLLCQDADDIPHPQRIEIINYFFSHYALDHLMYEYRLVKPDEHHVPFELFKDVSHVQFGRQKDFEKIWHAARFTNGNVALARHVFTEIHWPNNRKGEDTLFNRATYRRFKNCIIVRAILHGYRAFLSSTAKTDVHNNEMSVAHAHNQQREKRYSLKIIKARKGDER